MDPATLVALLGAGGLSAIIAAIVTGMFSKRKLGAEATEIITKAATGVVSSMQEELDRQIRRNKVIVEDHERQMQAIVDSHEEEVRAVRQVLREHVDWDAAVIDKMAELGVQLPPAPPLLPGLGDEPTI